VALGVSDKAARVFQGMLLFFVLASDTLILYRVRFVRSRKRAGKEAAVGHA
jgi:simple sugar transport system permease protein